MTKKILPLSKGQGLTRRGFRPYRGKASPSYQKGLGLLEVLLALAVISIALTALLKGISQNIHLSARLEEKMRCHLVAKQGITMLQLGLLKLKPGESNTEVTRMMNQSCYWRVSIEPTQVAHLAKVSIVVSNKPQGPFSSPLVGFLSS